MVAVLLVLALLASPSPVPSPCCDRDPACAGFLELCPTPAPTVDGRELGEAIMCRGKECATEEWRARLNNLFWEAP